MQLLHVHVPLVTATGISVLDRDTDERAKDQEWAYLNRMVRRWMIAAHDLVRDAAEEQAWQDAAAVRLQSDQIIQATVAATPARSRGSYGSDRCSDRYS